MPISVFICQKFPPKHASLISTAVKHCFQPTPPVENPEFLQDRPIPAMTFLQKAKSHFGQAILDGAHSFQDPDFKGQLLPLWCLDNWERMHYILDTKQIWVRVKKWLDQCASCSIDTAKTQTYLDMTEWDLVYNVLGKHMMESLTLGMVLTDSMIHSPVMNTMCRILVHEMIGMVAST
jgi:hypothetical protein